MLSHRNDCTEDSVEEKCCRYPLLVDFDKFGWDFVVQPRQYHAYFCSGLCPFAYRGKTPYSHMVKLQLQGSSSGGPCCTPVHMSAITMIYYDDNSRLMVRDLSDMVVNQCGCN